MPVIHAPWWCLEIPPEWHAVEEEGTIVIVDPDDVGELCISVLRSERGEADRDTLQTLTAELRDAGHLPARVTLADLAGDYYEYQSEGSAWREWFLVEGDALVLVSYCCDSEHAGIDAAVIDEMLESFVLVDNSEAADNTDAAGKGVTTN